MKPKSNRQEDGSILMIALITITILTLICAVSLHVTTQTGNATTQTTSWQQSMSGAEAAVDQAMKALNNNTWTGWNNVALPSSSPLPSGLPTGGSAAAGKPGPNSYNYTTSTFALQGEAGNIVQMWVTIDNGTVLPISSNLNHNGPAYRIRAGAAVNAPGPTRVSNSKLDNDLRKINLKYDRYSTNLTGATAVRRIELVAVPVTSGTDWLRGITLAEKMTMSGSATVHSDIGTANSTNTNLGNMYVYGDVTYSGPAIQGTSNVQGNISTPFTGTFTPPVNPNVSGWGTTDGPHQYTSSEQTGLPVYTLGNYTPYTGGGGLPKDILNNTVTTFTATGPSANPTLIKVNGDFTVSGGGVFNLVPNAGGTTKYIVIWVTGKLTVSGGSSITQNSNVAVTWIVDKDVTISGGSYNNQGSSAKNFEIVGVGANKVTISSSSQFMGTVNAPGADVTISGSGNFTGAVLADTLTISGSGTFSFDTNMGGNNGVANYAYASWFEDNSNVARLITY